MAESEKASGKADGFSDEERAAIKERSQELRAQGRGGHKKADDERAVLDAIAEMPDADRAIAERIHALITAKAPDLMPKTWYGMPAYARNGKVVCFFQSAEKFKTRYATLGFTDEANLDEGSMWPTTFGLTKLGPREKKAISELVMRAVS